MKIIETTIYKCEHCGKVQFRKCDMSKHEKWCKRNPVNAHKCFQHCVHLVKGREEYYGYDYTASRTTFHCALTLQKMYSFIAERRKLPVLNDGESVRMPLECKVYKDREYDLSTGLYKDSTEDIIAW